MWRAYIYTNGSTYEQSNALNQVPWIRSTLLDQNSQYAGESPYNGTGYTGTRITRPLEYERSPPPLHIFPQKASANFSFFFEKKCVGWFVKIDEKSV